MQIGGSLNNKAIISILLGTGIGFILNHTTDGMIIGMVTSSLAFYGKDLITSFTVLKEDLKDIDIEITCKK